MRRLIFALLLCIVSPFAAHSQDLQSILQTHAGEVAEPSRRGVTIVLEDLVASGLPQATPFLEQWAERNIWQRDDGLFFIVTREGDTLTLRDVDTGAELTGPKASFSQVRPNGGVRREIGTALVQFQLSDPDITRRQSAVDSIARGGSAEQLGPLRASIETEPDDGLRARKSQLANYLAARFSDDTEERVVAIRSLSGDISVETRAVLNQILATQNGVAATRPEGNVAVLRDPMLDPEAAYAELVAAALAPARQSPGEIRAALEANIVDGRVGGVPLVQLNTVPAREQAYAALAAADLAPTLITTAARDAALSSHVFYTLYTEADTNVTDAAETSLAEIEARVARATFVDLTLDALSLASIFFLAAIGLAITFGVMKVINMAHGEFIMMGAYTGFVVQQFIPNYTVSIIVALPLAFAVTFGAGVLMERLVIRHLYHRPLETLLATFGISIALQQLAKNIFGTQARPLTSPDWLAGAFVVNDVIQISYIRIAIFVLAFVFLALILFILKRTRLGLEVRAVTQNPGMASSMGINPDRINMMTFGLGSGIAGIAGVAIGLYAKVTSEMGSDYIVQSFMTVVVGGVGNVWGTLAGATLIGFGQKGIEWLNPSNTLAAQTYMILLVILFIQFRPRGIVALKGRAAGDD
jgi:urea transport system permease protein